MTNDNTRIEWTDATWNPTTGCSKVSAGCVNCYAEAVSTRFGQTSKPWTHPHAQENVKQHPERLEQPLRWRRPRKIFVDSMSDLFHDLVPDTFIALVFAVMVEAPQHTYQVLTKRPERMRQIVTDSTFQAMVLGAVDVHRNVAWNGRLNPLPVIDWPLPNVWLGTSVEDQRVAHRIDELIQTPAAIRFLSCEPLIGPLDLNHWLRIGDGLHWVIVGGESGQNHRPIDADWVRTLRNNCNYWHVPFFFKQWGGLRPKSGGRELDGRVWDQMPATQGQRALIGEPA